MSTTSRVSHRGLPAHGSRRPTGDDARGAESALSHLERLLRRSLEDSSYCGVTWHKFVARSVDRVAALKRAFASGNAVELAREAQTLKGVAAGLAADELGALAEALEAAAQRDDPKEIGSTLARVCREIDRCAGAFRAPLAGEPV